MFLRKKLGALMSSRRLGSQDTFQGYVDLVFGRRVSGWCWDPSNPGQPTRLLVLQEGQEVARISADLLRPDLLRAGFGTGRYGFDTVIGSLDPRQGVRIVPLGSSKSLPLSKTGIRPAEPLGEGTALRQYFQVEQDHLSYVGFWSAASDLNTMLRVKLIELARSGPNRVVADRSFDLSRIGNRELIDLFFDPQPRSAETSYMVEVTGGSYADPPSLLITDTGAKLPGSLFSMVTGRDRIRMPEGLVGEVGFSPPWSSPSGPTKIVYSPVTQCNLNCTHCISRKTRSKLDVLSTDRRDEIAKFAHDGSLQYLFTDFSGDILWADHRWGGEIDFLISLQIPFHVDTNGVHLDEGRSVRLLGSMMDSLNISIDAATTKTYNRIRRGSPPVETILAAAKRFDQIRKEAASRVIFTFGFTLMKSNLHELKGFIEIANDIGVDRVECRHLEAFTEDMGDESLWNHKSYYNSLYEEVIATASGMRVQVPMPAPFNDLVSGPSHLFCRQPWDGCVVLGNGDVHACCLPGTKVGNLSDGSISDIWNSSRYQKFRLAVNSPNPPRACNSCGYRRKASNPHSYLPYLRLG